MRVGIVGAGAMGCLFAAKLSKSGNEVRLVERNAETISAIRKRGIRVKERGRSWRVNVHVRKTPGFLVDSELILVMVKAYSTRNVARELRDRIGDRSIVLTLQNGLGNIEVLSRSLGERLLAGTTTEASLRIGPGLIEHTGEGLTLVGELNGSNSARVSNLVQVFRRAGFESDKTRQVWKAVWYKAVLNSAINPVSALTRLRNGRLSRFEELTELMQAVLEEGWRVARAEGVLTRSGDLSAQLSKVLTASAKNRSSMLQDVLAGKRTEVRELNGSIVKLAKKHGLGAPISSLLLGLMRGLEASYYE